ncbi:MAG: hypothetical protein ACYC43_07955 [Burkholderiales bacterium]
MASTIAASNGRPVRLTMTHLIGRTENERRGGVMGLELGVAHDNSVWVELRIAIKAGCCAYG